MSTESTEFTESTESADSARSDAETFPSGRTATEACTPEQWTLEASYARLPALLVERVEPARFPAPRVLVVNVPLARELGLDVGASGSHVRDLASYLSGGSLFPGSEPIAQAYAGHQYGHFTMLGDGRAILLGERRLTNGRRLDVQLKGGGQTPFSRRGDGRAALGPMLREHLVSEAMHALGVPSTRSLAVLVTGEEVFRDGPKQGAILVRIAASHVRVGTFQYAAGTGDRAALRALVDHAIERHDPELAGAPDRARRFLRAVVARSAALVAHWQAVGFVHGVLNTDNLAVSGETIDYGPCAFLDAYDPEAVFSSIDRTGRYRFSHQPRIVHWNLARLAEALVPILSKDESEAVAIANEVLEEYPGLFRAAWTTRMGARLGFAAAPADGGEIERVMEDLLSLLARGRVDFTNAFLALEHLLVHSEHPSGAERRAMPCGAIGATIDRMLAGEALRAWRVRWIGLLDVRGITRDAALAAMRRANPAVIPRNHRVEAALAAAEAGDLEPFVRLEAALRDPFARRHGVETAPDAALDAEQWPAPEGSPPHRTFCGT